MEMDVGELQKHRTKEGGMNEQVTCWHTGAVTRMCECGGPTIPIATDGRREWAACPICGKTWDMKTLKEWKDVGELQKHRTK
jgi:hypothetical protein